MMINIALMKVVKCKRYAEDLLNGKLYCNSIEWFRQNHDEFEGDYYTFPERITLKDIPGMKDRTITKEEFDGPVTFYAHNMRNNFAYCMFSWLAPMKDDIVDIRLPDQVGSLTDLSKKFGPHTVVVNDHEFIERVDNTVRQNKISYERGPVYYADPKDLKTDSPRSPGFNKRECFSNEKEYRFLFDKQRPNCGNDNHAFCLEIGDIRDIAVYMKTDEIFPRLASIGTKSFCEKHLGMKGIFETGTPYDPQD